MVDLQEREHMVKTKLEARHQFGLYERLLSIRGSRLHGAYTLQHLVDVGGQGILFTAADQNHPGTDVLIKMPFLPYHRPAYFDLAMIEQARTSILWEAYILVQFRGTILPELYDFWYDTNPLYDPAWGKEVMEQEPYLAMEWIRGSSLEDVVAQLHTGVIQHETLEQLAWNVMYQVVDLCRILWRDGGFLYTDLRPQNIMLAGCDDRRNTVGWRRMARVPERPCPECKIDTPVRVIDAGSMVRRRDGVREFPHHPAYTPPAFCKNSDKAPDPSFVIYTLGKTLFQVLTNQEPLSGRHPSFEEPILKNYSSVLLRTLRAMILQENISFNDFKRAISPYAELHLWRGGFSWSGL